MRVIPWCSSAAGRDHGAAKLTSVSCVTLSWIILHSLTHRKLHFRLFIPTWWWISTKDRCQMITDQLSICNLCSRNSSTLVTNHSGNFCLFIIYPFQRGVVCHSPHVNVTAQCVSHSMVFINIKTNSHSVIRTRIFVGNAAWCSSKART